VVDDKDRLKSISKDHKQNIDLIDEVRLFEKVSEIIENRKYKMMASVNSEVTVMFCAIGHFINSIIFDNKRDEYGKKILPTLSVKLVKKYGNNFTYRNLYRKQIEYFLYIKNS